MVATVGDVGAPPAAAPNAGGTVVVAMDPLAREVQALNTALTKFGDTPGDSVNPIWQKNVQQSVMGAQILNTWEAQVRRSLKKLAKDMYEVLSGLNHVPQRMAHADSAAAHSVAKAVPDAATGASTSAPSKSAINPPTIKGSDQAPKISEPPPSSNEIRPIAEEIENYTSGSMSNLPSTWDSFEASIQAIKTQLSQSATNLTKPNVLSGKTAVVTLEKINALTKRAERLDQVIKKFRNLAQKYVEAHDKFKHEHPSLDQINKADQAITEANQKVTQLRPEAATGNTAALQAFQTAKEGLEKAQHYRFGSSSNSGSASSGSSDGSGAADTGPTLIDQSHTAQQHFTQTVNDLETEAAAAAPSDVDSNGSANTTPKGGTGGGNQSNGQQQQPKMPQMPKMPGQGQGQQPQSGQQGQGQQPNPGQNPGADNNGSQGQADPPPNGLDPDTLASLMNPNGLDPNGTNPDDPDDPDSDRNKLANNTDPDGAGFSPDGGGDGGPGYGDQSAAAGLAAALGAYPGFNGLASAARGVEGALGNAAASALNGAGANGLGQGFYPPGMGGMNGAKGSSKKNQYAKNGVIYEAKLAGVLPGPVVGSKPPTLPAEALKDKDKPEAARANA